MMRMNSSLKTFIATPGLRIKQFRSEFTKTKLISSSPDIQIVFNQTMIDNMQAGYQCAQRPTQCDDTINKFVKNITKI